MLKNGATMVLLMVHLVFECLLFCVCPQSFSRMPVKHFAPRRKIAR